MMNQLLNRSKAAKARVASVKERGGIMSVLRTQGGAIDLASIMVGVLVIGIIGGVIAAIVFSVIPWSQDQAAQGNLDAVNTAESVAFATSTSNGQGMYYDEAGIKTAAFDGTNLLQESKNLAIAVTTAPAGYVALVRSDSGAYYSIDNADPSSAVRYDDLAAANTALTTEAGGTFAFDATAKELSFTAIP